MGAHNLTFTVRQENSSPLTRIGQGPISHFILQTRGALCDVTDQSVLGPEDGSAAVQRSDPGSSPKVRQIWRAFLRTELCQEVMTLESERVTRVMSHVNNKKGRQVKL